MKKIISIFGMIFLLLSVTACVEVRMEQEEKNLIGGQKDDHECLVAAGYSWCEAKQKCLRVWEEVCDPDAPIENISELIIRIKAHNNEQSGIQLIGSEAKFDWMTEEGTPINTVGEGLSAEEIGSEAYDTLLGFFEENGFETDRYNIAAGTVSWLEGFKKGDMACVVFGGFTGYEDAEEDWEPAEDSAIDVEIKCGLLEN